MFKFAIRGFRCNQETDGRGSDEVGMFVASLPVLPANHPRGFEYTDAARQQFRIRWASNVDSGDVEPFQYPIGVRQDNFNEDGPIFGDHGAYLEVIMIMFEIDGGSSTKSQAIEEHNKWRAQIEGDCRDGVLLRDVRERILPSTFHDMSEGFGAGEDIIALDVWYINLNHPLRGSVEFGDDIIGWDPRLDIARRQRDFGITADLYKNPKPDGRLSETRSYASSQEGSRYTFEVDYTNI